MFSTWYMVTSPMSKSHSNREHVNSKIRHKFELTLQQES